jgi:hypothetical protein
LEFAARVNREIGQGSGDAGEGSISIKFISNARPEMVFTRGGIFFSQSGRINP